MVFHRLDIFLGANYVDRTNCSNMFQLLGAEYEMYICASACVFEREETKVGERRSERETPCNKYLEEPYVICVTPLCKTVAVLLFYLITTLSPGG